MLYQVLISSPPPPLAPYPSPISVFVQIRKGTKEIRALENTLKMMDGRNGKLKESKKLSSTGGAGLDEKQKLEEKVMPC